MKNIFSPEVNEARSWGDFQLNENEKMKKEKEKKKGGRRTRKNKKNY
jgi:hypothetical protein